MRKYVAPTLTVDSVVFQIVAEKLAVLLISRAKRPFKNFLALPGAYCAAGETTHAATARVLREKAGVNPDEINLTDQLYTFDSAQRDPRGHAVSVVYMALGNNFQIDEENARAENPEFFPVEDLPKLNLAFDHAEIINFARERLASKITYSNTIFALMPKKFTLRELQIAYEAVFFAKLDKRNFRKKILALDFLRETGYFTDGSAHRPAKLYEFSSRETKFLDAKF